MKKYLLFIFLLLVSAPWIYQYISVYPNLFIETQDELNPFNIWNTILDLEPQFRYGNYTYSGYAWISYLGSLFFGGFLFGKTYGIIHIIILLLFGFYGFYKLIKEYFGKHIEKNHIEYIALLSSFVFITSPSIFLYFKTTIGLTAPAIIFPLQLLLLFYIIENKKRIISSLGLFFTFFIVSHTNITTILLNLGFLVLFSWGYLKKHYLYSFFIVVLTSLPIIVFSIMITLISMKFIHVPGGGILESIREDFYSNTTSIFNILKQTADWAFFGGHNGVLYFDFAKYYQNNLVQAVGITFGFGLLLYSAFFKRNNLFFLFLTIFVIVFMLGNKFFIYDYLYHNFTPFQIFRNIQKFAPFLLFLLIISAVYSISKKNIKIFYILMLFGLIYNVPYYNYSYFFSKHRIVSEISTEWNETIDFLNKNLPKKSKVLLAPSVYVNEVYPFKSGEYMVGSMLDRFTELESYRFSPLLIGDYFIQNEMGKLFIPSKYLEKEIDIKRVENFMNNFHIKYLMITKDIVPRYELAENYIKFFKNHKNFKTIYSNKSHIILENLNHIPEGKILGKNISIQEKGNVYNTISLNLNKKEEIIFLTPFNPYWKIYLEPYEKLDCKVKKEYSGKINLEKKGEFLKYNIDECESIKTSTISEGIEKIYKKAIFENTHKLFDGYANSWTIDTDYIKNNFPKEYYKEKPDGSIDVKLTLYFKPQSYFYVGLLISFVTFLFLLTYLAIIFIKNRKK